MTEPSMRRSQRLTIMLRSSDHAHHHSLATDLLTRAKKSHLAGATLLQAVEGQGRSGVVHHQHLFREDMALSLVIVDDEDKITAFVEHNQDVLGHAFVIVDDVTAFRA
jgi:PII-like signaling protein